MGLDQRLHRRRVREAGLQLENPRPDLRHVSRQRAEAAGANRFHARGAIHASRALPSQFSQGSIYTGWAYPPKDYQKWAELVFQFAKQLRERYGDAEVKTWLWEVWNEPDIEYWKGTPEEYFKLYDYSADAVRRALPEAQNRRPRQHRACKAAGGRVSARIS